LKKGGFWKFWSEGPGSFVLAIAAALIVRWAFYEAYVIPSGSMLPTLLLHDHIFVNKMLYGVRLPFSEKWLFHWNDPDRGEVVVFKYPQDKKLFYIKRIIGVPGDRRPHGSDRHQRRLGLAARSRFSGRVVEWRSRQLCSVARSDRRTRL
jgi:signal peptidase I